jgi:hypothetical protein
MTPAEDTNTLKARPSNTTTADTSMPTLRTSRISSQD